MNAATLFISVQTTMLLSPSSLNIPVRGGLTLSVSYSQIEISADGFDIVGP